jgi:hypothetical protein
MTTLPTVLIKLPANGDALQLLVSGQLGTGALLIDRLLAGRGACSEAAGGLRAWLPQGGARSLGIGFPTPPPLCTEQVGLYGSVYFGLLSLVSFTEVETPKSEGNVPSASDKIQPAGASDVAEKDEGDTFEDLESVSIGMV